MTATAIKKLFSHGSSPTEWTEAHEELVNGPFWRALAFRGVIIDRPRAQIFLQLGCPACDTTFSKPTDLRTALEMVTSANLICYRTLDILTNAIVEPAPARDPVPEHIDDNATARLTPGQQAKHDTLVRDTAGEEHVENGGDGWYKCVCGHSGDDEAIAPCDQDGYYCDPTADDGWAGHLKCSNCRRYFHQDACKVLGFGPIENPGEFEANRDAGILGHARLENIRRAILTCQSDGGEVEIRDGQLFVRRCAGADWENICAVGDHTIEIVGHATVHLKRDGQVILAVTT